MVIYLNSKNEKSKNIQNEEFLKMREECLKWKNILLKSKIRILSIIRLTKSLFIYCLSLRVKKCIH